MRDQLAMSTPVRPPKPLAPADLTAVELLALIRRRGVLISAADLADIQRERLRQTREGAFDAWMAASDAGELAFARYMAAIRGPLRATLTALAAHEDAMAAYQRSRRRYELAVAAEAAFDREIQP